MFSLGTCVYFKVAQNVFSTLLLGFWRRSPDRANGPPVGLRLRAAWPVTRPDPSLCLLSKRYARSDHSGAPNVTTDVGFAFLIIAGAKPRHLLFVPRSDGLCPGVKKKKNVLGFGVLP